MGGPHRTSDWTRLYLAPGVGHCAGLGTIAPAPNDRMGPLTAWVEHGTAPEQIMATRITAGVTQSRPLCPYPAFARWTGAGSSDDAASAAMT